jgi:CTP:molybdopterin cytidylyltransferase MocA
VSIAAVVLAAGRGSRLESATPKPLLAYRGRPLVTWALDAARASGLTPVLLVVGHQADAVGALAPADVRVVASPRWAEGISQSLRVALDALADDASITAACIGLADQPGVGPDAYRRLATAADAGAEIAVATYGGVRRNPVLLARAVWDAARALTGDEGARQLMRDRPVVEVDCTGTGDPTDVDTLDDLRALEASARAEPAPES